MYFMGFKLSFADS